jgi:hydroxymethylglutaryl-CoA lyase
MAEDVTIREVGLRDGLQNIQAVMSTRDKLDWVQSTLRAGIKQIELCSFVPVSTFPQFADSSELVAAAHMMPGLVSSVLVPNLRGAERAFETPVQNIIVVVSVSDAHSRANVRRSTADAFAEFLRVVKMRGERAQSGAPRKEIALALATSFGCSIAGPVEPIDVIRLAERGAEAGADEIILADTVGYASPRQVADLFEQTATAVGPVPLAAHFHNTRGLACANAAAAYDAGVTRFDAALAGLGGCPFAPGATGNAVTEDLVFMFEAMGVVTGVDVEALMETRQILLRALPGIELHGEVAKAGLPKGFPARAVAAA